MTTGTPAFYPSCPYKNDTFYACDYGSRFLGCCNLDSNIDSVAYVCNNGCPKQIPASFEAQYYNDISISNCSSGSDWYVCEYTKPAFFGCYKSKACANDTGCPSGDLTSAILSTDEAAKAPWYPIASRTSTTSSHRYAAGAVVGGVIGIFCGVLLAYLCRGLFVYHRRKAQRSKESESDTKVESRGTHNI